jgi:hypothetical protein
MYHRYPAKNRNKRNPFLDLVGTAPQVAHKVINYLNSTLILDNVLLPLLTKLKTYFKSLYRQIYQFLTLLGRHQNVSNLSSEK